MAVAERDRRSWDWDPWEAKRARLPKRAPYEVRDTREDARLLLMVVRARFAEGRVPTEHVERLAAVATDERVKLRERRIAASLLARVRLAVMGPAEGGRTVR